MDGSVKRGKGVSSVNRQKSSILRAGLVFEMLVVASQAWASGAPTPLSGLHRNQDVLRPRAQANPVLAAAPPSSPAPLAKVPAPTPEAPASDAGSRLPSPPPKVELRTDDLPPPTFTRPSPRPSPDLNSAPASGEATLPPPAAGQSRVSVQLRIRDRIYFPEGRSRIASKYLPTLKRVAALLSRHPRIKKVRVDGYADDAGSNTANLQLAEYRARAVSDYLVKNGVEPARLELHAFGLRDDFVRQPETPEERRRVEFTIVDPP